jgi:uncharacterized repeat protein (TIGR03803 family)
MHTRLFFSACSLALASTFVPGSAAGQVFTTIYSFNSFDAGPYGAPVPGPNGVLYGASGGGGLSGVGTVFELVPPASPGAAWTEVPLYNFSGPDGANPLATVTLASDGTLYGTTSAGGASNLGTVYQLVPPSTQGGAWAEKVLHSFGGNPDGNEPAAPVVIGSGGVLYGTTVQGGKLNAGIVFAVRPPSSGSGAWTEEVLHSFLYSNHGDGLQPVTPVVIGKSGALYGTAPSGGEYRDGAVYEVLPPATPGGAWTESVIWSFNGADGDRPLAGLALGANGALFGTTTGGIPPHQVNDGNVFELVPPASKGGAWTESVIYQFTGLNGDEPETPVLVGKGDALYGTTFSGGSGGLIFGLLPPETQGGAWTETVLYGFNGIDGAVPGQLAALDGALYGYYWGGQFPSDLAAFEIQP